MNCPNCNTWNPDDKHVCWRCQTELPKPIEKKTRTSLKLWGLPIWVFAVILLFLLLPWLSQCLGTLPGA